MRQETIFEPGDRVKCLREISVEVESTGKLKGVASPLTHSEVIDTLLVPVGTVGVVKEEAENFKGFYSVLFHVSCGDTKFLTVQCYVHREHLEFIPPEEKPAVETDGDTVIVHGD